VLALVLGAGEDQHAVAGQPAREPLQQPGPLRFRQRQTQTLGAEGRR
jgi:hypothetical protein